MWYIAGFGLLFYLCLCISWLCLLISVCLLIVVLALYVCGYCISCLCLLIRELFVFAFWVVGVVMILVAVVICLLAFGWFGRGDLFV